ncbi:MAG TPA: SLC13 family permease [Thermoanaerobaculia bacterium]|nr:SLC13 family permease [Thermoanaerobaculia bacterium]
MTPEIALVLGLLVVAMVLFAVEWLSIDLVALLLVIALVLTGVLTPGEAFSGFANEIIVVLASIFVLSATLVRTGGLDWLGELLRRVSGRFEAAMVGSVMSLSAFLSAFLSNTNVTAVLIPGVVEFAGKSRVAPSRLLIPLAYASMLGGTCTLIGTSTNMAASGLFQEIGMEPIGLFELAPVGLVVAVAGLAYMVALGYRLLPRTGEASLSEEYRIGDYLAEAVVAEDAPFVGKSLEEAPLAERGIQVLEIHRGDARVLPTVATRILPGDLLLVEAPREALLELEDTPGLSFPVAEAARTLELGSGEAKLSEAMVMPRSRLEGQTLRGLDFRRRFGVSVLALHRGGRGRPVKIGDLPLRIGDVLLLLAPPERLVGLQRTRDVWLLGDVSHLPNRKTKGWITLGALVGGVALGGSGLVPLSVALLLAALAVVLAGAIRVEEMYGLVDWRLLVLIGGMTSFGLAMEKTGAARWLAVVIAGWTEPLGVYFVLGTFLVLTMLLTQPMSNAAAALVVLPVAVSTALEIGVEPRTFALLVTLAASLSFIAPLEPACLLVYGPGKYRFRDFVIAGSPLSLLVFLLLLFLGPILWPL